MAFSTKMQIEIQGCDESQKRIALLLKQFNNEPHNSKDRMPSLRFLDLIELFISMEGLRETVAKGVTDLCTSLDREVKYLDENNQGNAALPKCGFDDHQAVRYF